MILDHIISELCFLQFKSKCKISKQQMQIIYVHGKMLNTSLIVNQGFFVI